MIINMMKVVMISQIVGKIMLTYLQYNIHDILLVKHENINF